MAGQSAHLPLVRCIDWTGTRYFQQFNRGSPQRMLKRLDVIERGVNNMKMPLALADQFYVLREHIRFVRDQLTNEPSGPDLNPLNESRC
jgi:hypothetical protein